MARKAKEEKKAKRPRGRRDRKPTIDADTNDRSWIMRSKNRAVAIATLNGTRTFPWWASMDKEGPAVVSHYFPACHFVSRGRVFYGFAFRHHREDFLDQHVDARREYTDIALSRRMNP